MSERLVAHVLPVSSSNGACRSIRRQSDVDQMSSKLVLRSIDRSRVPHMSTARLSMSWACCKGSARIHQHCSCLQIAGSQTEDAQACNYDWPAYTAWPGPLCQQSCMVSCCGLASEIHTCESRLLAGGCMMGGLHAKKWEASQNYLHGAQKMLFAHQGTYSAQILIASLYQHPLLIHGQLQSPLRTVH